MGAAMLDPNAASGLFPAVASEEEALFVHPTAVVDVGAEIGRGTRIWHFCHVMAGARIGRDVSLGQNVFVAEGAVIGDGCRLQNNVSVFDGVVLEQDVFCGPSMVFTNVRTPRAFVGRKDQFERTLVRRGASLGANCTIVCGVEIGEYALVAAGAVVTHNVLPHQLVAGVPAGPIGWVCQCGERLELEAASVHAGRCARCGYEYMVLSEREGLRRASSLE
jgi:UDP-2-acetamido-3-amino-2,3-dideoxy-glucuronate N-acetyltransferase